ncbi:hypothetical protein HYPSUDRAFT_398433 [Hypholoma sublateritium FD-334 SS-4]|uniref:Secreted protein n=1 Tax=Hypholoma sublateritium (strain FD-334 SS-4) TaxID=945553 RepID=A0A0D2P3P5_HYPSF|nr:hypothetical protein HYPSUDRAFT_398433 [Hypholoma sublateritium FD-334 SS-4]
MAWWHRALGVGLFFIAPSFHSFALSLPRDSLQSFLPVRVCYRLDDGGSANVTTSAAPRMLIIGCRRTACSPRDDNACQIDAKRMHVFRLASIAPCVRWDMLLSGMLASRGALLEQLHRQRTCQRSQVSLPAHSDTPIPSFTAGALWPRSLLASAVPSDAAAARRVVTGTPQLASLISLTATALQPFFGSVLSCFWCSSLCSSFYPPL